MIPYRLRENLRQWLLRSVHEEDFRMFDSLAGEPGLFLDLGANRGHAAISVLRRTRHFKVISLEPNPALRWSLALVKLLHPFRFSFRLVGAGDQSGKVELLVPQGNSDLSSQASLDVREFDKDYVQERLSEEGHKSGEFRKINVKICRVDDMQIVPDVVKIDVEGWEAQALDGLSETISRCRPVFIIELNNRERWAPMLQDLGYRFFTFTGGCLEHHADWAHIPGLNVICIHPDSPSGISIELSSELAVSD